MSGKVYFVAIKDPECRINNPYVKIGWTTDIKKRLRDIQTGSPVKLDVFGYINSREPLKLERYFHKMFSAERSSGEWFKVTLGMLNIINGYNVQNNRLDEFFISPAVDDPVEVLELKAEIESLKSIIAYRDKVIKERGIEGPVSIPQNHNPSKHQKWGRFMRTCKY